MLITESKASHVAGDGDGCESLGGIYSYYGRLLDGGSRIEKTPVLTNIVFGKPPASMPQNSVRISHDIAHGTLSAYLVGESTESNVFSSMSARIDCNNGRSFINRNLAGSSDGTRVDGEMRVYLSKDQHGGLIARRSYRVSSFSLFVIEREKTGEDEYIFEAIKRPE